MSAEQTYDYRGPITKALTAVFRDMAMLPDCMLGGEPVNKAANSGSE